VIYHLSSNIDEVIFPLDKLSTLSWGLRLQSSLATDVPRLLLRVFTKSVSAMIIGLIAYDYIYRQFLWNWAFSTLQYTYDFPRNSQPRRSGVPAVYELEFKFLVHAFLLTFLWDIINYVFSALIVAQPLKNGKPITSDSKDPNGTLLSGIRSRRQFQRVFYCFLWETVLC
jgi:nucleoporin NDC1